jgi:AmmeMemoRadiSam system protein B
MSYTPSLCYAGCKLELMLMRSLVAFLVLIVAASASSQSSSVRVKRPVCPGVFFPAETESLKAAVQQYLNEASVPPSTGRLVAVIAPESKYPYSGSVAAHAFKTLQAGQYDQVVLLTPSNFADFRGCSIPAVEFLITPIKPVPVDTKIVDTLIWSPLIDRRGLSYAEGRQLTRNDLHEQEYGDEVNLPFLQETLQKFNLIPIVVGTFEDYTRKTDFDAIDGAAAAIKQICDDRTLIVVCTDFTRYGRKFEFVPFTEDVLNNIKALDDSAFEYVMHGDIRAFDAYIRESGNAIHGANALMILMRILGQSVQGNVLKYDTSARIRDDLTSSVSYAAMSFYDPALPPAEVRPIVEEEKKPEPKEAANETVAPAEPDNTTSTVVIDSEKSPDSKKQKRGQSKVKAKAKTQ